MDKVDDDDNSWEGLVQERHVGSDHMGGELPICYELKLINVE